MRKLIFLFLLFFPVTVVAQGQLLINQEKLIQQFKHLREVNELLNQKVTILEKNTENLTKIIELQNSQITDLKQLVDILLAKETNYIKIIENKDKQLEFSEQKSTALEKKLASKGKKDKYYNGASFLLGVILGFRLGN